jgi:hypothetical protein
VARQLDRLALLILHVRARLAAGGGTERLCLHDCRIRGRVHQRSGVLVLHAARDLARRPAVDHRVVARGNLLPDPIFMAIAERGAMFTGSCVRRCHCADDCLRGQGYKPYQADWGFTLDSY